MHLHTKHSYDSSISPKQIVGALNAHSTVKGVAITDHDTLEGYLEVHRLAAAYRDILIIPGIEVSTNKGDIILLGVEEKPPSNSTVSEVVDYAKEKAALVIIPHPYRICGIGDVALNTPADAVEIFNLYASVEENKLAEKLAKVRGLPGVAGSDAHSSDQMLKAYTQIEVEADVEQVLQAIKNGRIKAIKHDII